MRSSRLHQRQARKNISSLLNARDADASCVAEDAEDVQKPEDNANHDDNIEYLLNLSVHRDVGVDQPEQHADDDQADNE